jgi:hypothetical protein
MSFFTLDGEEIAFTAGAERVSASFAEKGEIFADGKSGNLTPPLFLYSSDI